MPRSYSDGPLQARYTGPDGRRGLVGTLATPGTGAPCAAASPGRNARSSVAITAQLGLSHHAALFALAPNTAGVVVEHELAQSSRVVTPENLLDLVPA